MIGNPCGDGREVDGCCSVGFGVGGYWSVVGGLRFVIEREPFDCGMWLVIVESGGVHVGVDPVDPSEGDSVVSCWIWLV
jgi:hypothetical protein